MSSIADECEQPKYIRHIREQIGQLKIVDDKEKWETSRGSTKNKKLSIRKKQENKIANSNMIKDKKLKFQD